MNKNFKGGNQGGFTLIELIVVIVILGILAATALPKFANLGADARTASLKAARGALASASALVRAQALVRNTLAGPINMEGVSVTLTNGYPSTASIAAAAGITTADYDMVVTADTMTLTPLKVADKTKCQVVYNAAAANAAPVITETATDCN